MPRVQCTPLIGLPQFDGWSQVVHTPSYQFVAAFAVAGRNAGNVGRDLLDHLSQVEPNTAAELHTLITDALHMIHDKECELYLAASLITPQRTALAAVKGSILLKRDQRVGVVVKSAGEVQMVEGKTHHEDVMVFATEQASIFLGEIQQKIERGFDIDTIITSLVPTVHGAANSALSALAFVNYGEESEVSEKTAPLFISSPRPAEVEPASESWDQELVDAEPEGLDQTQPSFSTENAPPAIEAVTDLNQPTEVSPLLHSMHLNGASSAPSTTTQRSPRALFKGGTKWLSLLLKILKKILSMGSIPILMVWQRLRSPQAVYLNDVTVGKKGKQRLVVIAVGVCLLAAAIAAVMWYQKQQLSLAQAKMSPLQQELNQTQAQFEQDPVAAREKMALVVAQVEQVAASFSPRYQWSARRYLTQEVTKVQQQYAEFSGRKEFQELPIFYDATLAQSNFVIQAASQVGTTGVFLDKGQKQLLTIDLEKKSVKTTTLPQAVVNDVVAIDTDIWLLGQGLWKMSLEDSAPPTQVREEGDSNRGGTLLGAFGPYVYVLNPEKRALYRYTEDDKGKTSEPIGWLKPGQDLEFGEVSSLAIDGEVWIGTRKGEIKRFATGTAAAFTPRGLAQPFSSTIYLWTNADVNELYVLEPAKRRVVVLQKDGTLLKEVSSPSLASTTGLIVVPSLKKAFAISGSLLFEVQL